MIVKILWIAGSLPFIVLGTIHLVYSFFTNKLAARDAALNKAMQQTHPVLTKQTTMAKAWTGFNASHSAGAIYIGLMNVLLATHNPMLLRYPLLQLLNVTTVLFYMWLAKKYWFRIPLAGIAIAAICYISAIVISVCN